MAALLQMSRLHIGVDSVALHIAAAVGTPTITIYGPSDWRDWAPPGDRNRVVLPIWIALPATKKVAMEVAEASVLTICLLLKYRMP